MCIALRGIFFLVYRIRMAFFNKLKTKLTEVLPGNPLLAEYDINFSKYGLSGPHSCWKIYNAVQLSTKRPASVFVLDKSYIAAAFDSKHDRELAYELAKRGLQVLTRVRHPRVLAVYSPLQETRDMLTFATEPVLSSLSCYFAPVFEQSGSNQSEFDPIEIKYGLLQLCEGLKFLHCDAGIQHGNLCSESVVVLQSGEWRLGHFEFSQAITSSKCNIFNNLDLPYVTVESKVRGEHGLYFTAPEYCNDVSSASVDIFSLGILFHAVYNKGELPIRLSSLTLRDWQHELKSQMKMGWNVLKVPGDVVDHVKLMVNHEPNLRPDSNQLCSEVSFFQDSRLAVLQCLDTLASKSNVEKAHFFKGLPAAMPDLPKRLCLHRLLSSLKSDLSNVDMVPFLIPILLSCATMCHSPDEFDSFVWPLLAPTLTIRHPITVPLMLLQNVRLLLGKCTKQAATNRLIPFIYDCLSSQDAQLQVLALQEIPAIVGDGSQMDSSVLQTNLVPRMLNLCLKTASLNVRVKCLVCLGRLLPRLDRWFVTDNVINTMTNVPTREPPVIMAIVGIYRQSLIDRKLGLHRDIIVQKIIPHLFVMSLEPTMILSQYEALQTVLHAMIDKVEREQRAKLKVSTAKAEESAKLSALSTKTNGGQSSDGVPHYLPPELAAWLDEIGAMSGSCVPQDLSDGERHNATLVSVPKSTTLSDLTGQPQTKSAMAFSPSVEKLSLDEKQQIAQQQRQLSKTSAVKSSEPLQPQHRGSAITKTTGRDLSSLLAPTSGSAGFDDRTGNDIAFPTQLNFQTNVHITTHNVGVGAFPQMQTSSHTMEPRSHGGTMSSLDALDPFSKAPPAMNTTLNTMKSDTKQPTATVDPLDFLK